jgi:hypothetical protein
MRLLSSETLEIFDFSGTSPPTYAILSHRWQKDEVSFQDVRYRQNLNPDEWSKVERCCALAKKGMAMHMSGSIHAASSNVDSGDNALQKVGPFY